MGGLYLFVVSVAASIVLNRRRRKRQKNWWHSTVTTSVTATRHVPPVYSCILSKFRTRESDQKCLQHFKIALSLSLSYAFKLRVNVNDLSDRKKLKKKLRAETIFRGLFEFGTLHLPTELPPWQINDDGRWWLRLKWTLVNMYLQYKYNNGVVDIFLSMVVSL